MTVKLRSMAEYAKRTQDFAYFGDKGDWLMAFTSANCSDIITRANFIALQRALPEGSYCVEEFKGPLSGVYGGWVLLDPNNTEAIDTAIDALRSLEDYPVLDDEVLYELEHDEAVEAAFAACDIDRENARQAAEFIVQKSEENDRGIGYASEYWPSERDVFFGYLAYRRYARCEQRWPGVVEASDGV